MNRGLLSILRRMSGAEPNRVRVLIYGATGYSGALLAEAFLRRGLEPTLSARGEARLAAVAERFGCRYRAVSLDRRDDLERALTEVDVVLNAAGPFGETASPIVAACRSTQTHYLDLSGEHDVFEALAELHVAARRRGVMLMPGVGFDVVASDCLTAHVSRRLPSATHLQIGITGLAPPSRGSAKTVIERAGEGVKIREDGDIQPIPVGSRKRNFDFGNGPTACVAVGFADVFSAYYTSGIPNIEVYYEAIPAIRWAISFEKRLGPVLRTAPWQVWLKAHADLLPAGPSEERRAACQCVVVAEAWDDRGNWVGARLRSPEGYTFTTHSAPRIVERVLQGDFEPGFQTPGRVYGPDFVLSIPGVVREDLGEAAVAS